MSASRLVGNSHCERDVRGRASQGHTQRKKLRQLHVFRSSELPAQQSRPLNQRSKQVCGELSVVLILSFRNSAVCCSTSSGTFGFPRLSILQDVENPQTSTATPLLEHFATLEKKIPGAPTKKPRCDYRVRSLRYHPRSGHREEKEARRPRRLGEK